jgi:UDP-N-acetylglucosamine 2-epimerase (non-hydrolysing)
MMHILHIVGARAQFMKAAPVMAALATHRVRQTLVHAGQPWETAQDPSVRALGLGGPDVMLRVDCGTTAERTAQLMVAMETCLLERNRTWCSCMATPT